MLCIDARGMRCPWPAIRAARALREAPDGGIEILADDPAAERELAALAAQAGLTIEVAGTAATRRFRITARG